MTPHDLLAAFETLSEAPDSIARLRELVLQLAVRGKLAPQDPTDELACILLERIAAQKERLVEEGKIPKPMPLPPLGEDEVPFAVPAGWVWCRAEHLFEFVTSGSRGWATFYSKDGPVFLRIGNLDYGTTRLDLSNIQHVQPPTNSEGTRTRTMIGDILVSITGDTGMVGLIPDGIGESYINQHIAMCRPLTGTCPSYIAMAFTSPPLLNQLWGYQRGVKNSLGLDDIRVLQFPLPPLPEQHRIVAKVDALMALLDRLEVARSERETARAASRDVALAALRDAPDADTVQVGWTRIAEHMDDLFTDPADVAPLRQTILQLAVRGKLVPQDPSDEPACALLEHIAAEKGRLVKEGRIPKPKTLPLVGEDEAPFEVPKEWVWVRLGTIALNIHYGYTASANHQKRDVLLLRITDIQENTVNWLSVPGCNIDEDQVERYRLNDGDIVVARTGGTVGKTYRVTGRMGLVAVFASYLIRVKSSSAIDSTYLKYSMEAPLYWDQLLAMAAGTGQPNVNATSLSELLLPLPPLAEQHRIVAKVDALMALCDALETHLAAAREAQAAFAASAVHYLDI